MSDVAAAIRAEVRVDCCAADVGLVLLRAEERNVLVLCPETDRRVGIALVADQAVQRGEDVEQLLRRRDHAGRIRR
jgi:hypothetical protein